MHDVCHKQSEYDESDYVLICITLNLFLKIHFKNSMLNPLVLFHIRKKIAANAYKIALHVDLSISKIDLTFEILIYISMDISSLFVGLSTSYTLTTQVPRVPPTLLRCHHPLKWKALLAYRQ